MPFRMILSLLWLSMLTFSTTLARAGQGPTADFFVSPQGNDAWSGTLAAANADATDGPLATLQGARDAIRRLKARGPLERPIRVLVRGGTYRVTEPIVFSAEDSGTEQAPITYAAWPGEKPVISGGIPITGWEKAIGGGDSVGDRTTPHPSPSETPPTSPSQTPPASPSQAPPTIWTTVVPAVKGGNCYFRQLFVDGRRATPARVPNDDFFRSGGPGVPYKNRGAARGDTNVKRSIHYQGDDLKPWSNLDDVIVVVYHSWTASRHRIKSLDTENKLVEFTAPSGWPMGWWEKNQRYYVEFVPEGLDAPGEWYLDRHTGVLSYYPRPGEDMATAEVIAPLAEELVRLEGDPGGGGFIEHLRFQGLSFQHTAWNMPQAETVDGQAAAGLKTAAVYARGARHCLFQDCQIAHTGGYALWLQLGSKDNRIEQCHIHDMGAGGVRIGEAALPDQEEQQTERNEVYNCFIHNGGNVYHAGVGVWIGRSSHNTVHHNEICDFFYTGVSVGWSWGYAPTTAHHNRIEYNHIHHLGWGQLSDMGGIYCLGISPGTRLCHNRIHDVLSYSYGGWGLYTDEGSTEILMENNVVYRVKDGAFHQHYGRENIVRNNVLALSATYGQIRRSREEEHRSFTVERNIIYSDGVPMLGGNWSNGNYKFESNCYWDATLPSEGHVEHVPPAHSAGHRHVPPMGGRTPTFPGGLTLAQWQEKGQDAGSLIADPRFTDPDSFDFSLRPDSPALSLGFKPIDTSRIGLVGPADWVDLPKQVHRPRMLLPGEE